MHKGHMTSFETAVDNFDLADLINVTEVQCMMDNLYKFSHIPMSIVDRNGKLLVGVGWQKICTDFHRINPETCKNCLESDLTLTAGIEKGQFRLYKCKNGMWDMATPIYIGDSQMGNLFIGQFFFEDENIDLNYFRLQASRFNFNATEYLEALKEVPFISKENLESAKLFFIKLADSLSQLSYSNITLVKALGEKEKAERLLEENRVHLERSQEIAHLGSWKADHINNSLTWSDEVYRIFGSVKGNLLPNYEEFLNVVHPDDRDLVNNAYKGSIKDNRNTYEIEHRIIRRDSGEIRFVHEKCEHLKDESGRIICSIGMIHDITDRKKTEESLIESKLKLNLALENGRIGIWEWNLLTDELTIDQRIERMAGIKTGSLVKAHEAVQEYVHEDDVLHLKKSVRTSIEKKLPLETVFRIKSNNGTVRYVRVKGFVASDGEDKPVSISGVSFDITDLQEETNKLVSKLNEDLLRSNKELERFAYIASHDLQEPLRMVSGFSQMLLKNYSDKLDNNANEYISYIVDGASRMSDLLNDLLEYSRVNSNGRAIQPCNLNEILEIVKKTLSFKIAESKAVILSDELPTVVANRNQMIQLFQNLLSNSIKFSTGTPRIQISSKSEKACYVISVKDEGIGIDKKYFDKIFQIFHRLMPRDEYEGTGIGLAICKRIVEKHDGRIWVESRLGEGSTFTFSIAKYTFEDV